MRKVPIAVGGLSLVLACATAVRAQPQGESIVQRDLEKANTSYEQGRLRAALEQYRAALELGIPDPDTLAKVYLRLGILRASFGEQDAAREAFRRARVLDPGMEPPQELSPSQRELFTNVQPSGDGLQIGFSVDGEPTADGPTVLAPEVSGAPEGVVGSLRVTTTVADEETFSSRRDGLPDTIEIPARAWANEKTLHVTIEVLGRFGGVLGRAKKQLEPPSTEPPPTPAAAAASASPGGQESGAALDSEPQEQDDDRSVWASPWLWTGVGAVVIAGVVTGVLLGTAENKYIVDAPVYE